MKRIAALLAAILLLIIPLSVLAEGDGGRIDGPGFDTPEEALTAYIEAFQQNDLSAMLSTFAVETLAEHYDLGKQMERLGMYSPSVGYIPSISGYSSALNVEYRRAEIVNTIRNQYLVLTGAACASGKPIPNENNLPGDEYLADIFAMDDQPWLAKIDFQGEILEPQEFTELYYHEANQKNIARSCACYGGDELQSLAAMLEIGGEPYVQFMDLIRYGDRWYNLTLLGNLAILMGLDSFSGGLSPYPIPED